MRLVTPEVKLIARPEIDWYALTDYIDSTGGNGLAWADRHNGNEQQKDGQDLVEAAGRACYRSWEPGLNPNVTKVRTDQELYLRNILNSGHGSVLEHANYSFTFHHVSRVLTHELVRHRAGTAISQESMRYVRLDNIPFWLPEWALEDEDFTKDFKALAEQSEQFIAKWSARWKLDDPATGFHKKKVATSLLRRGVGGGHATDMVWTANIRALRHIIESRTAPGAEEEIRLVFGKVAEIMRNECPMLFGDFSPVDQEDGTTTWQAEYRKV